MIEKKPAQDDAIAAAYERGDGLAKIETYLGVGKRRIKRVLAERGIPIRKREEGRALALSQGRGAFGVPQRKKP